MAKSKMMFSMYGYVARVIRFQGAGNDVAKKIKINIRHIIHPSIHSRDMPNWDERVQCISCHYTDSCTVVMDAPMYLYPEVMCRRLMMEKRRVGDGYIRNALNSIEAVRD